MSGGEALFARVLGDLIADDPMWIGDDLLPLDYSPERESRIGDFIDKAAAALAAALPTVAQDEELSAVRERLRRPPCWGPNDRGEYMVDMTVESYEADLDALMDAARLAAVAARGDTADAEAVDMCWEFVDTGTCGHSDAEHDALADAARGDTPGAAAARAWDEGYAARRSEGPDSPGESNPYRAALSPEARP